MPNVGGLRGAQIQQILTGELKQTERFISSEMTPDAFSKTQRQVSRQCGGFTGMIRSLWRMLKNLITLKMFWEGSAATGSRQAAASMESLAEKTITQTPSAPITPPPVVQNFAENIEQQVGSEAQAGVQQASGWFSWRKIFGGAVAVAGLAVFHKEAALAAGKVVDSIGPRVPDNVKKLANRAGSVIGSYVPPAVERAFGKASEAWLTNAEIMRNTAFSTATQVYEKLPAVPESVKLSAYSAYEKAYDTTAPRLGQAWETLKNTASSGLEKAGRAWPKTLPQK